MASHFEIYDDQENKTVPRKHPTKKQTRSVLGEISQNTTRRSTRISNSNEYQVFPENSHRQVNTGKPININVISDEENALSGHPVAKSSQNILESRVPFSVIAEKYDVKINQVSQDSDSSLSINEDSINNSVFFDTSGDEEASQPPNDNHYADGILTFSEYSPEIYKFLKDRESQVMPKWNYMERQTDMTFSMRGIVVNWLVEVAEEYKLNIETLHLAVSYIDRFLSHMNVERSKLQLLGTACMFIAAKYEEIYPPRVGEFAFITDNTYTKKQVLRMEHLVLKVLGFDTSAPTSHYFVKHYFQMFNMDNKALHLSLYLNELSLLDGATFLKFPPSMKAASSVVLARHTLGMEAWSDAMAGLAGYSLDDLKECVVGLYEIFLAAPELDQQAVREKYMRGRYSCVAQVTPVKIV